MSSSAVTIQDLNFKYSGQTAGIFTHLNLEIEAGTKFGLFGPNGAGKTTLMNLMTGLLSFKEGSIKIAGNEMKHKKLAVNKLFGFVPQDFSFYAALTPVENLQFFGAWYGLSSTEIKQRTTTLLDILGLSDVKDKAIEKFSGGMKRRINLAIGVMHDPQILFLDEPTVGVDIQTRHAIIHYLKELNHNGTTLIYTSHQLSEAEELCERVALIDNGKIVINDDLAILLAQHQQKGLEGLFLEMTGKDYRNADV